ncbi:T-cell receptor beta chain T17T-22 [Tupaia chinensis]|nr:T-cell receptor beta chain T17T-22 [Tupaia chinensis]
MARLCRRRRLSRAPGGTRRARKGPRRPVTGRSLGIRPASAAASGLADSVDVGVTQTPRYLIREKKGQATLKCYPISGHKSIYWYQKALDQGPQFLVSYYEKTEYSKGIITDRFLAEQFSDYHSEMNMSSLELGDSAVYLCASSVDTALQSYWLFVPKPSCSS